LIRDYLIEQNLGLIYSIGSRFRSRDVEWDDVRGEAFHALVRAVEGFNPWFGFRFSTYACNAIRRALIHLGRKATQHRFRFPVGHDPAFEQPIEVDTDSDLYLDRLTRVLDHNLAELTDREVMILDRRFPRDGGAAMTLGEVGEAIGLSKERVRQIQKKALSKLREVLDGDPVLQ
jgi:RNA polymerase sigma factor (sigma-70 family)